MTPRGPGHLFVYGTLMPGRLRWPLLEPFASHHRPAAVPGTLFDSGRGWPVAVFPLTTPAPQVRPGAGRTATVPGHLVTLRAERIGQALRRLDEIEGTAAGLLDRVVVTALDGTDAWAYHHPHEVDGLTPIADWATVPAAREG
jgi:gamma-glutamylcyclotransferase (GGCT)/AIG2-like uncharacterized protein YtfP